MTPKMPFRISLAILLISVSTALLAAEEKAVHRVLDDFHDAAARADEARYFGHFTADAVFLGTDPGERWPVKAFREWARPYFQRKSAWVLVPRDRNVMLSPENSVAWFDEVLDSKHFGACRGTGVLRKVKGVWKVAHYNLTLPIPNDITRNVVRMIRATGKGTAVTPTTVFLVRHAETEAVSGDRPLSEAGRKRAQGLARILAAADLKKVYASEYTRTRETAAPAARAAGVEITVVSASKIQEIARTLQTDHPGQAVLVAGHSNTVPAILKELGVTKKVTIPGHDFGNLFVVILQPGEMTRFVCLRYGE